MHCYLISALIANNAGVGFHFKNFDGECRCVADYFDDSYRFISELIDVFCMAGDSPAT